MTDLRIGSLFSGVGGLDMAVEAFFGAETVWHCEWDEEPSKVLAARWPGVPNHRDVTSVDWANVEPVDILCGGFPCQDLSLAGRRSGMRPGTRSGLWADFKEAIRVLRPSVVVIENVRGLLSGCAESDLESCPGCVGDGEHEPVLRALGRVLGDLSDLGFDAEWHGLRASDIGAPHSRYRIFVVAYRRGEAGEFWTGLRTSEPVGVWGARRERVKETAANGNGFGMPLGVAVRMLPTVTASEGEKGGPNQAHGGGDRTLSGTVTQFPANPGGVDWLEYEPAVRLWEATTRPVPSPTRADGRNGAHRLSPLFTEWMMGYPLGWITDVIDRKPAIKAAGNGVVPQQAFAALEFLWPRVLEAVAA